MPRVQEGAQHLARDGSHLLSERMFPKLAVRWLPRSASALAPSVSHFQHCSRPCERLADVFSFGVLVWQVVSGPSADNPLCGLAEDEYCAALADGKRPLFIGQARSEEEVLATECWHIEAARRPQLSEVEHRLASLC